MNPGKRVELQREITEKAGGRTAETVRAYGDWDGVQYHAIHNDDPAERVAGLGQAVTKGRKKDRRMSDTETAAHEASLAGMESAREGQGPLPLGGDVGKCGPGVELGPGQPMAPGHVSAQDFRRDYETAGHAAPSPGHDAPHQMPPQAPSLPQPRRVDLTSSRATAYLHSPAAPGGE